LAMICKLSSDMTPNAYTAVDEQWISSSYRFLRNAHSEGINILYCDGHVSWKRAVIGDDLQAVFRYDAK
jgi:prepilin-type processing-associated H-X9-DG protein